MLRFCSYKLLVPTVVIGFLINTAFASSCDGQSGGSSFQSQEKILIKCLTSDYNPIIRPVRFPNETVTVTFSLMTVRISDIDEKNHMIKMKGWLLQLWNDPQLTWDKSKYGDIEEIRLPANDVWTPDIVLYNYEDTQSLYDHSHSVVIVRSDGTVMYVPVDVDIKASCEMDFSDFPYDTQHCKLFFGSWSNSVARVNITIWPKAPQQMLQNGTEWEIQERTLERMEVDAGAEYGGKYALAVFQISLKRNPVYYTYIYVAPAVLLSFVIVFIYLIPPASGERVTLGGAILIVLTLLLLMLENHLPTEVGSVPLLLRFLLYDIFMAVITLILSIMALNFHHRDVRKGKVPAWLRKIFLGKLSYFLCMQGSAYHSLPTNEQSGMDGTFDEVTTTGSSPRDLQLDQELQDTSPLPKSPTMAIEKTMDEIRRYLRICAAKATLPEPVISHKQTVLNEWHLLALIIDRILFVFFLLLTIIMAIALFSH